jgi:hypothetical protein
MMLSEHADCVREPVGFRFGPAARGIEVQQDELLAGERPGKTTSIDLLNLIFTQSIHGDDQADDLDEILAWREERTVTRNLTLHYDRMMLILDPTSLARGLVRKKVEIVNYPDGRFAVQFNGATLGFKVFDKIQTVQPGAIVDNKRLSAVLEQVEAQQAAYPARQRPPNNLEAPGLPSKGRAPRSAAAAAP